MAGLKRVDDGAVGLTRLRGIAAIGGAFVVKIFVRELDLGGVVRLQRHGRIDAVALDLAEIAERVGAFVEGVEAHRHVFVDRLSGIERETPVVPGAGLRARVIDPGAVGFLERAVEDAAAGATAEGQRARSLQDLDALRVVEIAEILHVIAKTVDEEVGAGIHAADDEFVAVAFALVDGDAGNVAGDVGEALEAWSLMKSLVMTLSDCGMLTSGVLVLVATDVELA